MPEFDELVRDKFAGMKLSAEERDEVCAEIAGHLELCFESGLQSGLSESCATAAAESEVADWDSFRRAVQNTRGDRMRERLLRVWIPGLVMGLAFFGAQYALAHVRFPQIFPLHGAFIAFDWAWVPMGMIAGAMAAVWSRAMGGSVRERISAALLPAMAFLVFFVALTPVAMFIDRPSRSLQIWGLIAYLDTWVVIPGVSMLLGALPFLREANTTDQADKPEKGMAAHA